MHDVVKSIPIRCPECQRAYERTDVPPARELAMVVIYDTGTWDAFSFVRLKGASPKQTQRRAADWLKAAVRHYDATEHMPRARTDFTVLDLDKHRWHRRLSLENAVTLKCGRRHGGFRDHLGRWQVGPPGCVVVDLPYVASLLQEAGFVA